MIPAPRPIITSTPSLTAIPQDSPYANLTTITLLDYQAIKENRTCVVPTIRQCLQDLYKRVSSTDGTPQNTSFAGQSYNATACSNKIANKASYDNTRVVDIVFFSFLLAIVAITILGGIMASIDACCCAKKRNKRREDMQRQAREELGLEIGNDDSNDNGNQTVDDDAAPPPRSSLWKSFSTRKTSPGSGPRSSASTGRSTSGVSHPYTSRAESLAVPAQAGRRAPSVFEGVEGLPLPPPVYEMADLDPMHEEDVSEAPRYSWEDPWREGVRGVRAQSRRRERVLS